MSGDRSLKRYLVWLLFALPSALVAAVGVFLAWGQQHLPFVHAAGTGETVTFRMAIPFGSTTGPPPPATLSPAYGCNTATLGSNDCGIPVDGIFTVQVFIDGYSLKNNDADSIGGYTAVQVMLNHDAGLGLGGAAGLGKSRTGVTELGPAGSPYWPECDTASAIEDLSPKVGGMPRYSIFCTSAGLESLHTGLVMEQEFICPFTAGKHNIELKTSGTFIYDDVGTLVFDPAGSRYLTVLCLGNKTTNPSVDSDSDGCSDTEEQGTNVMLGGLRNPNYYWDFYDTPNSANFRDKVITIPQDIFTVARRFGANDAMGTAAVNRNSNQLVGPIPAIPGYHPAFDRGPPVGPNIWNSGPADGSITIPVDIFQVARQFGHTCFAAP